MTEFGLVVFSYILIFFTQKSRVSITKLSMSLFLPFWSNLCDPIHGKNKRIGVEYLGLKTFFCSKLWHVAILNCKELRATQISSFFLYPRIPQTFGHYRIMSSFRIYFSACRKLMLIVDHPPQSSWMISVHFLHSRSTMI